MLLFQLCVFLIYTLPNMKLTEIVRTVQESRIVMYITPQNRLLLLVRIITISEPKNDTGSSGKKIQLRLLMIFVLILEEKIPDFFYLRS